MKLVLCIALLAYMSIVEAGPRMKAGCIGDVSTWNAGYGTCDTYAVNALNYQYCMHDCVMGQCASQVCQECGTCSALDVGGCEDIQAPWNCHSWKRTGKCRSNLYVKENCRSSCGLCGFFCMVNGQNGDGTEQGDCPDNTLCQKTGDCLEPPKEEVCKQIPQQECETAPKMLVACITSQNGAKLSVHVEKVGQFKSKYPEAKCEEGGEEQICKTVYVEHCK